MIYLKNAKYCGKIVHLLFSESKAEAIEYGIEVKKNDLYHKHESNYGNNYGMNGGLILQFADQELTDLPHNVKVIDAKGKVIFPSFIDVHVHFRDPGQEWKEDIVSGLSAALHGGYSHLLCMANTKPVNDNGATTKYMLEKARENYPNGPFLHPVAAATMGLKGEELAPLGELAKMGCIAVSNDGVPLSNTEIVRRVMEYAADLGMIFIDHCEDPYMAKNTHMSEGQLSAKMGVKGQPDIAEAIQVSRDILLSEYLDIPVHLAHISCERSLLEIERAKARGVKVSAETCPHYLLLTEKSLENYNSNAKVNPPLRTERDMLAMRRGLKSGVIDCLITDHAPHAPHEKEHPLDLVPNGLTGLDLALSLLWSMVEDNILNQAEIIQAYTTNPGEIFKLPYNKFNVGDCADFFLFDPNIEWEVNQENLHSKSMNTPWLGEKLRGKLVEHYLGGLRLV